MKIYLDMDGVIADFFTGLETHFNVKHWKEIPKTEQSILGLKGTDFFYSLYPFATSKRLVEATRKIARDDYGILSSPLRGDRDNSAYHKRRWLTQYKFLPNIDNLLFSGQKEHYATDKIDGKPNILVDDKPSNIDRWIKKGGIGIRYQANEDNVDDLITKLSELYKKT